MTQRKNRAGRPSSGLYGTIKDRAAYQRKYRTLNPNKRIAYRVRQAVNVINRYGSAYGFRIAQEQRKDSAADEGQGNTLTPENAP